MPKKCPPGLVCMETTNMLILLAVTVFIFIVYVFRPDLNFSSYYNRNNNQGNNQITQGNQNNETSHINANVRLIVDRDDNDYLEHSRKGYRHHLGPTSSDRISNPLLPPERNFEATYGIPINVPTRGEPGRFQQVGMLYKESIQAESTSPGNNTDSIILPLYGRPVHRGSNKWSYYTASDKHNMVKIPFTHNGKQCNTEYGCNELYDDDLIQIPAYNGVFKVKVYGYDSPRYIPYIV